MPGGGRVIQWKGGRAPIYWTCLLILLLALISLLLSAHSSLDRIGTQVPDSLHYYPISEGRKVYYVRQWVGWFLDAGGLLSGAIFFLLALIAYFKQDRAESKR